MDKQTALAKIKKCLALSKSANEHEAAQALKHAQFLMSEFGLTELDVSLAEVSEERVKAPLTVPQWHWKLVHLCGRAFGCDRWHNTNHTGGGFIFCGTSGRPELAGYAYQVLLRRLKTARREYMATALSRVRIAKNKTARADEFCAGWVEAVWVGVSLFARSEAENDLIRQYRERNGLTDMKTARTRDVKGVYSSGLDYFHGLSAGEGVRLDVPLGEGAERKLLDCVQTGF